MVDNKCKSIPTGPKVEPKQNQDGDVALFLLEVLVDKIQYFKRPYLPDNDFKTCVRVTLPDHPNVEPLVICDDDPTTSPLQGFTKYFNVGKSVLFALQKNEINMAMCKFTIETTVMSCGGQSPETKTVLGTARINFTKEFVKARQKYLADSSCVRCEVLQDAFTLVGPDNSNSGEISMYLRISCFGKLIVTRFQGKGGQLTTLGAGMSGPKGNNQQCKSPDNPCECVFCATPTHPQVDFSQDSRESADEPCPYPVTAVTAVARRKLDGYCMHVPQGAHPIPQLTEELTEQSKQKLNDTCKKLVEPVYPETLYTVQNVSADVKQTGSKAHNAMPCQKKKSSQHKLHATQTTTPIACRNTEGYCLHVPQGRTKKYEEVGTTLTGNELKIKVPAASAIIKKISQTHCAIQRPYGNIKDPKGPCDPPCGRNQISLALPCEDTCCMGTPPADTQFTCTTEGCTQIGKHAATAGFSRNDPKDPKPEKEILPNKDVYVLKVAKTSLEGDRKCKLELEFTAPKGGNKKLPIQKRNATLQSDACECCPRRRS